MGIETETKGGKGEEKGREGRGGGKGNIQHVGDRGEGEEEERGLGFEWISGYESEATRLRRHGSTDTRMRTRMRICGYMRK